MQKIIKIEGGVPRSEAWGGEKVFFELLDGEHIVIVGPNGGGKSLLADVIVGRRPVNGPRPEYDFGAGTTQFASDNIQYITFRDTYGSDNDRTYFLQQRWNQSEIDENTPTAQQLLNEAFLRSGEDNAKRRTLMNHVVDMFGMQTFMDKYVILLSSGELRKLKIAESILGNPRVLVIDNPFIGLDAGTRTQLRSLLEMLSREQALQIILLLSKTDDIPPFITHVVQVEGKHVAEKITLKDFLEHRKPFPEHVLPQSVIKEIADLPYTGNDYDSKEVARLNNVSIRYGKRTILKELNWTVMRGERWAVSGQNGAGKSTLLSLICADNPQSYAQDITLFGRSRGSGETIWQIKRHIGYVSPEMHRSYMRDIPALNIVASGLSDSVGLYYRPTENDLQQCRFWLHVFGLDGDELQHRSFMKLSSGEQRLVLLARAFVKDPELLILDEPLHGLDDLRRRRVKDIINAFCQRRDKTLIMVTHYEEELPPIIDNHLRLIKNE
jgi:molybdate transport system ATP-binding protein